MLGSRLIRTVGNSGGLMTKSVQRRNMSISSIPFGKRQIQQLNNWVPTMGFFGAAAFIGMCYITEWRVTNEWIPFYNGKFKSEENEKEKKEE